MKSVFAVIFDQNTKYIVAKRYDTDQTLFFLGGTYDSRQRQSEMDTVLEKIYEKSSLVLKVVPISGDNYEMTDGENIFTLQLIGTATGGSGRERQDEIFYFFFYEGSFSKYVNSWRVSFQENQITIVDWVIKRLRKNIGPFISYVDWLNLMVMYKNKYRQSNSLKKILQKRGLSNDQYEIAVNHLELIDIYLRYQNLSLVSFSELSDRNGLTDGQRDILEILKTLT